MNIDSIPLCLYIHTPWCIKKCPYCDFNSHPLRGELPQQAYLQQLIAEIQQKQILVGSRHIQHIFIGGGTPSLLDADFYHELFAAIRAVITISPQAEITLEANPGTVEQSRFTQYFQAGINRLSLGIQSFSDKKLMSLGRIHDGQQAITAVHATQSAGFSNFNLDLMYGLPQQSIEEAISDLTTALSLHPTHLSWYQLTLEPNTLFNKFPPSLPNDDYLWEMQLAGQQLLTQHAYQHYEISAYSREGFQCRHNLNYWQFGDYLGIGAGAHSKITDSQGGIIRQANIKHPSLYLQAKSKVSEQKKLAPNELPLEYMLNTLRLIQPQPLTLFTERTGLAPASIQPILTKASQERLISMQDNRLATTAKGRQYLNELLELFLN